MYSSNSDNISVLLKKADSLETKKEYEKAILVYNEALKIASEKSLSSDASFIYKEIGDIYYSQKKYDLAKAFFKKSIQKDSLSKHIAATHFNLSLVFRKQKKVDSLLLHLKKSLFYFDKQEDSDDKFNTFLVAGILLKNNGDYELAISYLIKAYQGFEKSKNIGKKASVCNTIASIQRIQGNYDIAKQYYLETLTLRETLGDSLKLSYGYNNLGNLLKSQEQLDSASVYYQKAIDLQERLHNKKELGKYYYNLGTVYFLQDKFDKAEANYKKSITLKKEHNDYLTLSNSYNELASVYLKKKKSQSAKQQLDSAKKYLNPNQNKDILLRHYDLQSRYYKSIKDYERSLMYREEHNFLYESLFQERQTKTIQKLQEQFESKQKAKRILDLTREDKLQKAIIATQEKDLKLRNLIIAISLVLLVLITVIYFLYKQKQKIKAKNLELFRLKSVFDSQEIIKEKISKDLHDIVTTRYDGIRLKIEALPNVQNPKKVSKRIVNEITEINEEIRLISHRISPLGNKIKDTPLTKIIEDQCVEFHYYRKIFVDIKLPLPKVLDRFTLESQTNFYGILLEVLNN